CWSMRNIGVSGFECITPLLHHSNYSSPATEDFMSNISGKYAIVGVAETKVGKRPDASTHSLHLECIKACLDDAGITAADVDEFGTTNEDLAHVAVATRKHACLNQNATMRKPMTIADHQASQFIIDPLHLFNYTLKSNNNNKILITNAERARDFPKRPVAILG